MSSIPSGKPNKPYSGYFTREVPPVDAEITLAGPGTPLGEFMRRFWQPVCLSSQLTDVPLPIRILNEDLVAFRDGRGRVGVLNRHCCHRGTSLEYGIIQNAGIRCCYHGFHFDVDGTILEVPAARDKGKRISQTVVQGAYPAMERDGLVFAYMGRPDQMTPFPEYDAFEKRGDTRLVPFSNIYPCNWLQVMDNIADQVHTSFLHNMPFLYAGDIPESLNWQSLTLSYFATVPVMDYVEVRGGTAMCFIAGRRVDEEKIWIRIQDCIVPNMTEHAYLFENGAERRLFHRVSMARWYVPVDDTNSIIFGWRMFGKEADPLQKGDESKLGYDNMDFLEGQVGNREHEESQRLPGDWETIVSQRPIAVHAAENPVESDVGVYMYRKLLRNAIRTGGAAAEAYLQRAKEGLPYHCYTQNTIMRVPKRQDETSDQDMIKQVGRRIIEICKEADSLKGDARREFIIGQLAGLERTAPTL